MRDDESVENKSQANQGDQAETGPSGGKMTEGGEKQGPPVDGDAETREDPPVSGIAREEKTDDRQSRGEDVE